MSAYSSKILFYVLLTVFSFDFIIINSDELKEKVEIVEQQIKLLQENVKEISEFMESVDDDVLDMGKTFSEILENSKVVQEKAKRLSIAFDPLDEHKLAEQIVRENNVVEQDGLKTPKQLGAPVNLAPVVDSLSKFNLTLISNFLRGIPELLKTIGSIIDASDKYFSVPEPVLKAQNFSR